MNVTNEQKALILRLRKAGKSLNDIAKETGINKPYVQAVCNDFTLAALNGLNGLEDLTTPNLTLFPLSQKQESLIKTAQRPAENWQYPPNYQSGETTYLNSRIKDLESDRTDLRKRLNDTENELATTKKEFALQTIDFKSLEKQHQLEKNDLISQHNLALNGKPSALNGLIDKITSNDKVTEIAMTAIMAKLLGTAPQMAAVEAPQFMLHASQNEPEHAQIIAEITEFIGAIKPAELKSLHTLLALFIGFPNLIFKAEETVVAYVNKKRTETNPAPTAE